MKLTVYSGTDCSNCDVLKKFLDKNEIKYIEFNIRENERAKSFLLAKGFRSIPQVFLNGEYLGDHNTAKDAIINKLRGK